MTRDEWIERAATRYRETGIYAARAQLAAEDLFDSFDDGMRPDHPEAAVDEDIKFWAEDEGSNL